ncbi:unnamed protein product [Lepidochelys kempii]
MCGRVRAFYVSLPMAPIQLAAPLSPSERSSARPLWAAGLLPGPPPDLETAFNDQVCGGHRGGRSPHGAPATQPPASRVGGGVPLSAPEVGPGRSHQSWRPPGLRPGRLAGSPDARSVHGALQTLYSLVHTSGGEGRFAARCLGLSRPGPTQRCALPTLHPRPARPFHQAPAPWAQPTPFTVKRRQEMQPVCFQTMPSKHLYTLVLHTLHALTLMSCPNTKWRDLLPPLEGEEPRWASLYYTLVPRPNGDISWWLLHRALSTGVLLTQFTSIPDTCPFCGVRETLAHIYLECARLQPLFRLLTNILLCFWLHFSPHLLIYTLPGPLFLDDKSKELSQIEVSLEEVLEQIDKLPGSDGIHPRVHIGLH